MILARKDVLEGEVLPPPPQLNSLLILIVDVLRGYPLCDNELFELLEVTVHDWLIEALRTLWVKPVSLCHGDSAGILPEEVVDPFLARWPSCQIINQGGQFCMRQRVSNVTTPSAPINESS